MNVLARGISKNNALEHLRLNFDAPHRFQCFVRQINKNFTITVFDHIVFNKNTEGNVLDPKLYDLKKVNKFLARNRGLLWRNIHPKLLDFALIFHHLPAYIVLEIFDWLLHMDKVRHGPKIKLIIGVKKSIQSVRKT